MPIENMGTISINHPQIFDFIKIKTSDKDKQWVFNFSVNIPDDIIEKISNKIKKTITLGNGENISTEKFLDEISESIFSQMTRG